MAEDANKRPLGRLFLEAMVWGAGFGLILGGGKLLWGALTKPKPKDDDDIINELDEGEG